MHDAIMEMQIAAHTAPEDVAAGCRPQVVVLHKVGSGHWTLTAVGRIGERTAVVFCRHVEEHHVGILETDDVETIEATSIEDLIKKLQDKTMASMSDQARTEQEMQLGTQVDFRL